jgi:hypothetical protein
MSATASDSRPESMRDSASSRARSPARLLSQPALGQWAFWMGLITLVKLDTLLEPPVWDSAMGVFPPAIELYRSGFDIQGLLQMGNWWTGGPNVHSLSLYTWVVAAVMRVTQSAPATFLTLHLATFALVAWSLVRLGGTLRALGVEARTVLAASGALLCLPLVAVQVGYLYTETWVMAFGILAWAAWCEGGPSRAISWATLALGVKMTGLAIAAALGGALLLRVVTGQGSRRERWLLPVLPIAVLVVRRLGPWLGAVPTPGPRWGDAATLLRSLFARLGAIPDVTLLLVGGMLAGGAMLLLEWRRRGGLRALVADGPDRGGAAIALVMPAVFCAAVVATAFGQILFLPRYLLPALPFSLASMALLAHHLDRERALTFALLALSVFGLLNWHGRFYTPEHVTFSVVERSHAYQDYHTVQRELIDALAEAPPDLPVFVSKEIDYMISDPMMGYIDAPPEHVEPLYHPRWVGAAFDEYPPEFLLAYSNPGHGGEIAARILEAARARPDVSIRTRVFEREGFRTALFWIRHESVTSRLAPAPAPRGTSDPGTPAGSAS